MGYNAYRSDDPGQTGQRLNVDLIPAHYYGQSMGDTYTFQDYGAPQGETVYYWLEELTDEPGTLVHGPVTPGGGLAAVNRDSASRALETVYHDIYNSYYYLGGQRIALRRESATLSMDYLMYLLSDHLGTVRLETYGDGPNTGNMRASTPTLPYGEARAAEPMSDHWYTGQYFDRSEDLYDYGARPYDPLLGLFIQPDTIVPNPGDPQALNRYSYALNNPVKYIDSDGHFAFVPLLIAGGVGFLAAGGIDLAKQLIVDQKSFDEVNWAEVGGSAVGGLVAGATLGLAPAGAGVISLALLGGAGGAAGSQAQALTQAGLEEFLGTNPQGSVIQEAMDLGLFDPATIAINGIAGGFMGGLSPRVSNVLRSALHLPESAGTVRLSGEVPMVRWQPDLGWTIRAEGRTLQIPADVLESVLRGISIGSYETLSSLIEEAIEQGLITVLEDITQP